MFYLWGTVSLTKEGEDSAFARLGRRTYYSHSILLLNPLKRAAIYRLGTSYRVLCLRCVGIWGDLGSCWNKTEELLGMGTGQDLGLAGL